MKKILIISLILSGCSSIRMNYSASLQTEDGREASYSFRKSYDVSGGIPLLCGVTAIFFGGACWYYLVMPTVPQEKRLETEATKELSKKLKGKPYTLLARRISHEGWTDKPAEVYWEFMAPEIDEESSPATDSGDNSSN